MTGDSPQAGDSQLKVEFGCLEENATYQKCVVCLVNQKLRHKPILKFFAYSAGHVTFVTVFAAGATAKPHFFWSFRANLCAKAPLAENRPPALTGPADNGNMNFTYFPLIIPSVPSEGLLPILNHRFYLRAIAWLTLLPLAGCVASGPGNNNNQQQQIQVTVSPSGETPVSIPVSTATPSTQQFTATVTGAGNQAVTWSLLLSPNSAAPGSGTQLGSIDANGLYTAPPSIQDCPANIQQCELQVAVVATSAANSSFSGQAPINIHIIVTMSPAGYTNVGSAAIPIGQGANLQFSATVTGASNQSVNWLATCTGCVANQGGGAFDPNNPGLFIASDLIQGVTSGQTAALTATSAFDTTQVAQQNVTQESTDPVGTAAPTSAGAATIPCPTFSAVITGAATEACYQLSTSCPGVADFNAYLKVDSPASPIGTVLFTAGSGGTTLYDDSTDFFYDNNSVNGGLNVVQGVLNANYTTVQISFALPFDNSTDVANGWLQGPGGVRRLACRYATVAQWVYTNIHNSSTTAAYCATGNSAGASAIGYALSEYGQDTIFNMVEPTSGPVTTSLSQGCSPQGTVSYGGTTACTNPPNLDMSYSTGANGTAGIIDTAYQAVGATAPTLCTDGITGADNGNFLRFQSDSIDFSPSKSPALPIPDPPTTIKVLFGGDDGSNAVGQGETWWKSVGPAPTQQCVGDAPHAIPAAPSGDGVTQIVSDITSLCKVQ